MAMLASAAMSSLGSCSSDELLDGTNKLPGNAIAFNVTQQGALSRGTETNSGNFQNRIQDFQVWAYFDKAATGTGVTPVAFMSVIATQSVRRSMETVMAHGVTMT